MRAMRRGWPFEVFLLVLVTFLTSGLVRGQHECPTKCLCFRTTVRCMFLQMTTVPDHIPLTTTVLDLRFNKIRVIPGHTFRPLKHLNTLLLNNNQISRLEENAFLGLKELRHLYLYKNQIHYVSKHAFRGLPKLEQLYLHFNRIQTLEDETFGNLPALERLFLHHNQLHRVPRKAFQKLESLRRLRLDSNALVCDCEVLWLVEMLEEHRTDPAGAVQAAAFCQEPQSLHGKALATLRKDDFHCRRPSLLQEPTDVEVSFGGTAYFHCRAEGDPDPHITWYHNSNEISQENAEENRLSLLAEGNTLMITGAQEGDQGLYECMARNAMGETKSRAARMTYKPSQGEQNNLPGAPPEFQVRPSDVTVTEGSEVVFECQARGKPPPEIIWLQGQRMLTRDNSVLEDRFRIAVSGSLTITDVRSRDAGTYRCLVTNSVGRDVSTAQLQVNKPPRILDWSETDEQTAVAGHTVDLVCRTDGEPAPVITWFKDGRPLEARGRRVVFLNQGAILRLNRARPVIDDGLYSCQAHNSAGTDQRQVRLQVLNSAARQRNRSRLHPHRTTTQPETPRTSTVSVPVDVSSRDGLLESSVSAARLEVDRSINETLAHMFQDPSGPLPGLGHLFRALRFPDPEAREIAKAADVFQRAMEMLHHHLKTRNGSTHGSLLTAFELRMLANFSGCFGNEERRFPQGQEECDDWCFHSRYRTVDGRCNNLQRPDWGASLTPFRRLLPARYVDGIQEPIGWSSSSMSANGHQYPSARLVSSAAIMTHSITPDPDYTHMLMQWGQFLDHDLDFSMPALSHSSFSDGASCLTSCENRAPCFPIPIPETDVSRANVSAPNSPRCIEVVRSSALCGSGLPSLLTNKTTTREQVNQLTSYLDGSNVYGSTVHVSSLVRDRASLGLLRTSRHLGRTYLPYAESFPMDCHRDRNGPPSGCFLAGDVRANEQLGLLAMHTLWVREHNRIANRMAGLNPGWDSDRIFHESRKIVGAVMQHITYQHWLPKILGQRGMEMLGSYKGYDPDLNPSVSNVFATAALRFGHTLINPVLDRLGPNWDPIPEGPLPLHKAFFAPHRLLSEGGVDPLLRGLVGTPAKLRLPGQLLNEELINKLFTLARDVALDLGAINIQRGRDHGIPSYWEWRKLCNLSRAHTFDDLRQEISDPVLRRKLAELYGHPDNIDLWVGGVSEDLAPGARVGPTFRCLLADQFRRLRDGDRFWYENPSVFSVPQLTEIRRRSLGGVLCASGDGMTQMTPDVFRLPGDNNPITQCYDLPKLQLQPWKECCGTQDCGLLSNSVSSNRFQRSVIHDPSGDFRKFTPAHIPPDLHPVKDVWNARMTVVEEELMVIEGDLARMNASITSLGTKLKRRLRHTSHCSTQNTPESSCTDETGQQRSLGEVWKNLEKCQTCYCRVNSQVYCQVATPCPGG